MSQINSMLLDLFRELSLVFGSAIVTYLVENYFSRRKIKEIRRSYLEPYQVPTTDRRNIILLIGLGGTGKTALIRSLLDNEEASPEERTGSFDIYYSTYTSGKIHDSTWNSKQQKMQLKYWFFIADYIGQNLGTLIRGFIQQQKREYSPLAFGYVNSLILVVDLWPPKKNRNDPPILPQSSADKDRIETNIAQWNDTAIDAVFGLLTEEIEYVCLFINKVDLMTDRDPGSDEFYIHAFDAIKERLNKRCGDKVEVLLGSAKDGKEITTLRRRLMENSVLNDVFLEQVRRKDIQDE